MLRLVQEGAGRPLVLLHGAGTSHVIWRQVIPGLASRRRRVMAPDLPGYGGSPPAGGGFRLAEVADRLVLGLQLAGAGAAEPFDLVGHSLGGAVAITLAHRHPDLVRRLVLVAPAGLAAAPPGVPGALRRIAEPVARVRRIADSPLAASATARRIAMLGVAADGARVPPREVRALVRAADGARRIGPGLAAAAAADLTADLAALPVPVGLVWGARDPVIPPRRIARVLELRPDTPVRIIPGTAHAPQVERPAEFTAALTEVLRLLRHGGRPAAASAGGNENATTSPHAPS